MCYHSYLPLFIICLFISFDSFSQCYPDRHNTGISSTWISCSQSTNPNAKRNRSHWILYDLNNTKAISDITFWNLNHPDYVDSGAKEIAIDYVDNKGEWIEHGLYNLERAGGSAFYEGETIELEEDIISSKILISILENHGGACSGLSEVKFELREVSTATENIDADHFKIEIAPNPFSDYTSIEISLLKGTNVIYQLTNNLGQIVLQEKIATNAGKINFGINGKHLASGNYFLKIIDGQKVSIRRLSHQTK